MKRLAIFLILLTVAARTTQLFADPVFRLVGSQLVTNDSAAVVDPYLPKLPQLTVDTALPAGWDGPPDATPADSAAFQDALDDVDQDDDGIYIIELTAGATYTGPFKVRKKPGNDWLIIRTSDDDLPATGTRVVAADATDMAKITGTGTGAESCGLWHEWGAHHVRYIGIEFTTTHSTTSGTATIINVGYDIKDNAHPSDIEGQNHHIIFDRCYIHGTATGNSRQGIQFDAKYGAVIDSRIANIHEAGADNQAIMVLQGAGPYVFSNNYLEAAGENIMFGGADPAIDNMVPSDITIRRNHFFKPLTWKANDPSYAGVAWTVKNLFELKNSRRVLIEGNVFENCWPQSQTGFAIVFTPRNQDGNAPWCTIEDVTFRKNFVKKTNSGIQILSADTNSENIVRMLIENNLILCDYVFGGISANREIAFSANPAKPAKYLTIRHNTILNLATPGSVSLLIGDHPPFASQLRFNDNLISIGFDQVHGPTGSGTTALNHFFTSYTFLHNALIRDGVSPVAYPATTLFPADAAACNFTNYAGGDYTITSGSLNNGGSDGTDIGADIGALNTSIRGVEE